MNNPGEINKLSIWIVILISITVIFLLFYNLLFKESLDHYFAEATPKISEKCVDCHSPSPDMSFGHRYERIGCVSCHKGNPDETEILAAHSGMISIPGNLSTARESCGATGCHPGITERVENSLMNTMSGVVNIQRYVFGESNSLNVHADVADLTQSFPDAYTRNLCASCHLGREKLSLGPITELSRGGGCNACHLNYTPQAAEKLANWGPGDPMHFHPSLSLNITNDHCFGCHSRSGRISTSYEGWHESQLKEIPDKNPEEYRKLVDKRIFVQIKKDVHHTYGLDCIDCHSGMEIMGDGKKYFHAEDAVRIRCEHCHFNQPPETITYSQLDFESQKIVDLRAGLKEDMHFIKPKESTYVLVNVIGESGDFYLVGKNTGKKYPLSPQNKACSKGNVHSDLSCSACHTSWTPQCITCHVSYDPTADGIDLLAREPIKGKWIEKGGHFLAEWPTLGVMEKQDGQRSIQPFVPGMILRAEPSDYPLATQKAKVFKRLYAPIEAHTTQKTSRTCSSCHLDANTLGYGRGKLEYDLNTREWHLQPIYPIAKEDGLPEDAWIGLYEEPRENRATRINGRPFNKKEQEKILRIGICLQCHDENSELIQLSLTDFSSLAKQATENQDCGFKP